MDLAQLHSVPIDAIRPSPHQARKFFDEENLWKLAESMRQEGLIQPITVRKLPSKSDDPLYELVSGERRLRAAKLLNWTAIEARVISVVSEGEVAAKGLIENLQRENLNPLEEAEGFAQLNQVDTGYWTHERVAQVTGKSRTYITQSLSLLKLPAAIKNDVRRRTYSRAHALEIARLPGSSLQLAVAKRIPDRLTREQTRKLVDAVLSGKMSLTMLKPEAAMDAATLKEEDPLAGLWPDFVANPWIAPHGSFQVRYLGRWKWSFELKGPALPDGRISVAERKSAVRSWLGDLLVRMGRSLSGSTD